MSGRLQAWLGQACRCLHITVLIGLLSPKNTLQFSAARLNRERSWHWKKKEKKSRGTERELLTQGTCPKAQEANAMTNYQFGK